MESSKGNGKFQQEGLSEGFRDEIIGRLQVKHKNPATLVYVE